MKYYCVLILALFLSSTCFAKFLKDPKIGRNPNHIPYSGNPSHALGPWHVPATWPNEKSASGIFYAKWPNKPKDPNLNDKPKPGYYSGNASVTPETIDNVPGSIYNKSSLGPEAKTPQELNHEKLVTLDAPKNPPSYSVHADWSKLSTPGVTVSTPNRNLRTEDKKEEKNEEKKVEKKVEKKEVKKNELKPKKEKKVEKKEEKKVEKKEVKKDEKPKKEEKTVKPKKEKKVEKKKNKKEEKEEEEKDDEEEEKPKKAKKDIKTASKPKKEEAKPKKEKAKPKIKKEEEQDDEEDED